jgi:hypothetical protein
MHIGTHQTPVRSFAAIFFLVVLTGMAGHVARAQLPDTPQPQSKAAVEMPEETTPSVAGSCVQPPPMVRLQDYDGPLKKVVGTFAARLERRAAHLPHYKPGVKLCTLELKDKFILFAQDLVDPVTFLSAAFSAGIDQSENGQPSFGQGAGGYGKRFGAELANQAATGFFKDFAYPWIFSEDPRYYRLAHGSPGKRLLHAVEHAVVAHRDGGRRMFNFSEWLGTTSAVVLSNTYLPDNEPGFAPAAQAVGFSIGQDVGFDILREFWPEISRKLKLPFRGASDPAKQQPVATK